MGIGTDSFEWRQWNLLCNEPFRGNKRSYSTSKTNISESVAFWDKQGGDAASYREIGSTIVNTNLGKGGKIDVIADISEMELSV